jgi:hypothetical protein
MVKVYQFIGTLFIIVFFSFNCAVALDWKEVSREIPLGLKSVIEFKQYVVAEGQWRRTFGKTIYAKLPLVNATYIVCNKQAKTCNEATAVLYTPEDTLPGAGTRTSPSLSVLVLEYKIIDWSGGVIRAKSEDLEADIELRISVKDQFAERSFRETKARGSDKSDPNIFESWILE